MPTCTPHALHMHTTCTPHVYIYHTHQVIAGHRKEGSGVPPTEIAPSQRAKIERLAGEYVKLLGKQ